jgi:hypothetical protein
MNTRSVLWHVPVAGVLLLAAGAVWGEEALSVVKLRTDKVALYDCKDATKKAEYASKDFHGPWKASPGASGTPAAGFLQVDVNGQRYCVKPYAVETNKRVSVAADCNAVVAATQPKSAATRGIGEECNKR